MTVRVALPDGGETLGTGVAISRQGLIVTCRHVLEAGGLDVSGPPAPLVDIHFPPVDHWNALRLRASVVAYCVDSDDDLVCLRTQAPIPAGRTAVLGDAAASEWHEFIAYGYRRLGKYRGLLAQGMIMGEIEAPEGHFLVQEPVQLRSSDIAEGMSGAPVLDRVRNLVVGMVSEKWGSGGVPEDRDTAWAVNARLVTFPPFSLVVRSDPLPMDYAEPPRMAEDLLHRAEPPRFDRLESAPTPLTEWVARDALLAQADRAAEDPETLVAGLIGFGGEGKTTLVRQWVEHHRTAEGRRERHGGQEPAVPRYFWWSFTERPGADDFLEAALDYVSGGRITSEDCEDGRARAEIVASLLSSQPYVFVLDGLETVQEQRGDHYGSVLSPDLRDFLTFFATPGHRSLCLITSRAPLVDLIAFVTYRQIDVPALTAAASRDLLVMLGVHGSHAALERVGQQWGGHALTLSLIAAYLVKRHGGDVRQLATLPAPDPDLPRTELVRRVLGQYDACLSETERWLLRGLSVFRTPVGEEALEVVLAQGTATAGDRGPGEAAAPGEGETSGGEAAAAAGATPPPAYTAALIHLVDARVVRRDERDRVSTHPLVRAYYASSVPREDHLRLHAWAKRYYLRLDEDRGEPPATLEGLAPVIEAVHHACRTGAYAEAYVLVTDRLYAGDRGLITRELSAYDTVLACLADFFPRGDVRRRPYIHGADPHIAGWLLHEAATSFQMLGRLWDAVAALRRAEAAFRGLGRYHQAAISCQNRVELHLALGQLTTADEAIEGAFDLARRAGDREDELVAETLRGTLCQYRGEDEDAERCFAAALRIARACTPLPLLYSWSGIHYAEHLRTTGRPRAARLALEANLSVCRRARWTADEAACLIGLGHLALDRAERSGEPRRGTAVAAARTHFEAAHAIAHGITRRDVLIRSLLARCRLAVVTGQPALACGEATRALTLAAGGGYRIAEVEARLVLVRVYHDMSDDQAAWEELSRASEIAQEIGYRRGEDAVRALESIVDAGGSDGSE
ncbi:trypsin-like peptidase domain-containing protein [Actinomycetota bacterium Odt1-20B]